MSSDDPLKKSQEFFQMFSKAKDFTEELLKENERLRFKVARLETGGAPGGYRFGRGWKSRLLALESGQTALEWINSLASRA